MKTYLGLLGLLGLLAGCTEVGPDYRLPQQAAWREPTASAAFQAAGVADFATAPVPDGWWRLYRDAQLDRLVQQALAANTDLRQASANLRKALALEASVAADANPHATLEADAQRGQAPLEASQVGVRPPAIDDGGLGLSIGYEVDLFGKLARAEEAAHADAQASVAAEDLVRVTVAAQTVRAYVQGCSATRQLNVAQQQLDLQARSAEVTQRLAAAGRGSSADVERARAQEETLRASLPQFSANRDAARYRLAALLGRTPAQLPAASLACSEEPRLDQPIPVGEGADLLRRRPDIRQAERQLAGMTARIGVATAQLYPSVTLGASAGLAGRFGEIGESSAKHWSLGPLISWSIPDSGARARVKAAEADSEAALARFDGVVLEALRETETALTFYARELQRNQALRAAREHAQQAARDSERLYGAGRLPYLASLDANRTLADSEAALAASDARVAQDQVDLFLALGGGWSGQAAVTAEAR